MQPISVIWKGDDIIVTPLKPLTISNIGSVYMGPYTDSVWDIHAYVIKDKHLYIYVVVDGSTVYAYGRDSLDAVFSRYDYMVIANRQKRSVVRI